MAKKAYLWIVVWEHNKDSKEPCRYRYITADLFFSSREAFAKEIGRTALDVEKEQLVEVSVPDDFDHWDFIPDNY